VRGRPEIWYDDLVTGQRHRSPRALTVEADDIVAFARQFDPQPQHLDPVAAQRGLFGGLVASGWHTAAVTMRLLTETLPLAESVGAGLELAWPTPTRPGDQLALDLTVVSKRLSRTKPDRGLVELAYDTVDQSGQIRQRTRATVVMLLGPGLRLAGESHG
jgi:acyl dehydratase